MDPASQTAAAVQAELVRRHRTTVLIVRCLLFLTVIFALIGFLAKNLFRHQDNPSLDIALRISILIFGLGSVVLRRTRFSTMRLTDIAGGKGASALLKALQNTTLQVAGLGGAIALIGFAATIISGNTFYTYGAGLVGFFVLLYCYPTSTSWQHALQKFVPLGPERLDPPPLSNP